MRQAYIIIAYKDPAQIERLIKRLNHKSFDFYIHLDKKIDKKDFIYLSGIEQVYFIKNRALVRWGSHNLTVGILNSFNEILSSGRQYDFICVTSAQDYLIKPISQLYSFLKSNIGKNFIYYEDPGEAWWSHNMERVNKYHMTNFGFKGRYRLQHLINGILPKRNFPLPYKLYGGPCATHMTLSTNCVRYVVDFMRKNKGLQQFAFFSWGTDEYLIDTIIMNSPFKDTVVNNNLYYIDWSAGGFNPKTFTIKDFEALKNTDKFYARKFDIKVDDSILDKIDSLSLQMV
jgi:Core-2/I-Branching enzyme